MSFTLPTFGVNYLEYFSFCALLDNTPPDLVTWVGGLNNGRVETSYDSERDKVWIMAIADSVDRDESDQDGGGDDSTQIHFHVGCALNSFFEGSKDGKEPPNNCKEFQEFCNHFVGKQLTVVDVISRFVIPETDLPKPSIANLLGTTATVGDKKVVIDSLKVGFVDSQQPYEQMEWIKQKNNGDIIVRLQSTDRDVIVTDSYLENIQELLSQALDRFILERERDVDAS